MKALELLYKYQQADEINGGYMSKTINEAIKELEALTTSTDLAGPLQEDGTIKLNESIKIVQTITVKNKENGDKEGSIIDIDGCKIFRSGDSMIILPQNDDL